MANRIVNFQMQQPGEMQQPQAVGNQQQKRQSLADRLRRYGAGLDSGEGASNAFDQQVRNSMLMREPQTPQQQQASKIMKSYNAPGGGSEMGWNPSALLEAQRGMFGATKRLGNQLQESASAFGRGASNAGSAISKGFGSAASGFGKLFA
jgi:hypothetical protein